MHPEDLGGFATLSDPQIHPDGTRVAFVVSRMDLDEDRYDRSIWLWDGEAATPFTSGSSDSRPRWSSDGKRLAFIRAAGDDPGQVAVMATDGGEARVVTSFELGAGEAEWSPDGVLAVTGRTWKDDWADLEDDERAKKPRRIDGPKWRFDDRGYIHDREQSVYLVDPEGDDPPTRLTSDHMDSGVTWRPDGKAVAFVSARHDRAGFDFGGQAWEVSVEEGEPEALVAPGIWDFVSYRPDGSVYLGGIEDETRYPSTFGLYRLDAGTLTRIAADYDRNLISPAPATTPAGPVWFGDDVCRIITEDRGTLNVLEIDGTGSWSEVVGGRRLITGIDVRPDGAMALVATSVNDPGELIWFEGSEERVLTDFNAAFRAEADLVEPEFFTTESEDLDVWVFLPPGEEKVPVLLNIHGGPATQYGWGFFDEFQVYVGAGYGVVATNPRGSSGRGEEFVRGPVQRWSEERPPDLEDILAATDAALARFDRLDPDRMGIMGGSYGGLMTAKILAVDHRWKSAVPERGLYNFASFAGTSDIGFSFPKMYVGERDYSDWSALWEASPIRLAHQIDTPCLIIHSDSDFRCPVEQAEQLFSVLLDNGVEVDLLRFPGESHELSRGGKPVHRRQRFEAILDWHGRHLGMGRD